MGEWKIQINITQNISTIEEHSYRDAEHCSISYLFLCNKLLHNVVASNTIYYLTVSVGQELGHGLAGSSASGFSELQSKSLQPRQKAR